MPNCSCLSKSLTSVCQPFFYIFSLLSPSPHHLTSPLASSGTSSLKPMFCVCRAQPHYCVSAGKQQPPESSSNTHKHPHPFNNSQTTSCTKKNLSLNDNWFKKEQDQCNLCEFLIYLIYMTGDTGNTREREWTYWARKVSQKGPQFYSSENIWQPLPHLTLLDCTQLICHDVIKAFLERGI